MASNRKPTRAELELLVHCQQQVLRRVQAYLFMAAQYQHSKHEAAYTALLLEVIAVVDWAEAGSEAA